MRFKLLFFAIALVSVATISAGFYSAYGIIAGTTATILALLAVIGISIHTFKQTLQEDGRTPYEFKRD